MALNPADPHDLRFVITDVAGNSPNQGEMFVLDPSNASGVPLSAFRTGASLPPNGTIVGEGFFVTGSRRGYVWDGLNWQDITPNPIKSYATDADLLVAVDPAGTYATTQDTGDLYYRLASGWKQLGARQYPNYAALIADTSAPVMTLAELVDEGTLWEKKGVAAVPAPPLGASGTASGWTGVQAEPAMTPGQVGLWMDITAAVGYTAAGFPLTLAAPVPITINMSDGTTRTITLPAKTYPNAAATDGGSQAAANGLGWQIMYEGFPNDIAGTLPQEDGNNLFLRIDVADSATVYPVTAAVVAGTSKWVAVNPRDLADLAAIQAWNEPAGSNIGNEAIALDTDIRYIRMASGWKPISVWADTENNIRAATWPLEGQQAHATDTGNFFVWRAGQWVEDPIQHYRDDATLLAATPPDGTFAWADDTGHVYARIGTTWKGISTGFADPIPIGTIMAFPSNNVPGGWLKCDGSAVPADSKYDELRTVLGAGNNVPDLQGEFLRGARPGQTILDHVDWTTGRPKTKFTSDITGVHDHQAAQQQKIVGWTSGSPFNVMANNTYDPEGTNAGPVRTDRQGGHQHSIDGGGDGETAPDHTLVVWCIKGHHSTIAPSAYQMDYQPDNTTLADKDILQYDAAHNKWINITSSGLGLQVVELTQAAYDALTPDPGTLYLITGP